MAKKDYYSDYRVVERVDERGRRRKDFEYIGAPYRCMAEGEELRREKRRAVIAGVLGYIAYVVALLPASAASHTIYITLPFVFAALPLGIALKQTVTLPTDKPLERRTAERLADHYPAAALFTSVLPLLALAGEGVCALKGGVLTSGDALFSICAALLAACGVYLFIKRRSFDTRKI